MNIEQEDLIYFLALLISFISTYFTVPWLINQTKAEGLTGKDMNKLNNPSVSEMGGISVIFGFFLGIYLQLISYNYYIIGQPINEFLLASIITVLGIGIVGILDDLFSIRQRLKAFLPFFFALPLGIFVSEIMYFPFFGEINFGKAMLLLVPFGVTCAANSTNMLEGFNGLSTGLGIIIVSSLVIMEYQNNQKDALYLLMPLLGSLLAFYLFNRFPAKIFPGDTLTLFLGGVIGCSAIISNLKLEGIILLSPMIIEFFLKLRGKFGAECFAESINDGILIYNGRIESLTHLVMQNFQVDEKGLVRIILLFEILIAITVISLNFLNII